jgi:(1->4)-alpha-D-glucan 1-alpha-D-glucosylmutase
MSEPRDTFRIGGTRPPRATYRIQFNRDFTFEAARRIVPYLARLGISHLYASPILKARPGSAHGYDVVDHTALNPELGTPEDFERLVATLHEHGLGLIVDIVPNHLGIMGCENEWWLDLLENGPAAQSAKNFDVDWQPLRASLRNRVLVPVLGEPFGTVLENGELKLEFDAERGSFRVRYCEHCFPIDPREYPKIFAGNFDGDDSLPPEAPECADFESLLTAFANLPPRDDTSSAAQLVRYRDKEAHKRRLARLVERSPAIGRLIDEAVNRINGKAGEPRSFDALERLLDAQAYRLANWRVAIEEINYRRFFDVNDLAALRMNEPSVFERTHELLFKYVDSGHIDGLRIDHSDGLFDPLEYFTRLQRRFGAPADKPLYVVTEKILAAHESLPLDWPVHGTTGYDFAALAGGWLVKAENEAALTRIYRQFTGVRQSFDDIAYQAKKFVMRTSLAAEVEVLATQLDRIAQLDRHTSDFTRASIREAIVETIARFPVYRTYVSERGVGPEDRRIVEWASNVARANDLGGERTIFEFLKDVLLGEAARVRSPEQARAMREFAMKFQQVTAPVTAKGVEDTAFYRYHRLVNANEVGGDPRRIAFSTSAVHQQNLDRYRNWPHSMLATSTHDTKRSEDVRARIAVISELPELWKRHLSRWSRLNRGKRRQLSAGYAPNRNDEYLIYQTLVGVWSPHEPQERLLERIRAYLVKAAREAKRATSWRDPNVEYEEALAAFAAQLLADSERNAFLRDFASFAELASFFGHLNSLVQTILKLTSPGVPDIYQGTEVLSLALVDPDNRRPVDYESNSRLLDELAQLSGEQARQRLAGALRSPYSSDAKLFLTWRLLQLRREWPEVFAHGEYTPLQAQGGYKEHVLAFAREHEGTRIIVVLGKCFAALMNAQRELPIGHKWTDTTIALGSRAGPLRDAFTGVRFDLAEESLSLAQVFEAAPFAVLVKAKAEG